MLQSEYSSASRHVIIKVGQDRAGHWLVQEDNGLMEGRFVSFPAAMAFARAERHAFRDAEVLVVEETLVPYVAFDPIERRAAA
ncbi:hypothetical protein FHS31_001782 [Sphingomonas vulcanisoli]|uniref:DUF2188 domain-containing protein n=1 Tax=Sphingomonas vulcanisoli TaxID=1658060 RepID=A0ABX0TUM0_9SPHN|nr:hypothetical protein [Sphingomonas vulcanisoli]NIJ08165.1 hypothetical protein [Sphingomonas vulcanisoli]